MMDNHNYPYIIKTKDFEILIEYSINNIYDIIIIFKCRTNNKKIYRYVYHTFGKNVKDISLSIVNRLKIVREENNKLLEVVEFSNELLDI